MSHVTWITGAYEYSSWPTKAEIDHMKLEAWSGKKTSEMSGKSQEVCEWSGKFGKTLKSQNEKIKGMGSSENIFVHNKGKRYIF